VQPAHKKRKVVTATVPTPAASKSQPSPPKQQQQQTALSPAQPHNSPGRAAAAAAVAALAAGQVVAGHQLHPQQQQQQQPPAEAEAEVSWLPQAPAAAAAASPRCFPPLSPLAAAFRTHHQAFQLTMRNPAAAAAAAAGQPPQPPRRVVIRCGDFVLVSPQPGEGSAPRVVQLLGLWQETPPGVGGVVRMLARGRRFYHPADTLYQLPGAQVFMTQHYEERLPLAAVLDRCEVVLPGGVGAAGAGVGVGSAAGGVGEGVQQQQQFVCNLFYDHVHLTLRPLSAEEVAGASAAANAAAAGAVTP
jgi:hypothetical protein